MQIESMIFVTLAAVSVVALGLLVVLFFVLAPGPKRARAFRAAQKQLDDGDWETALASVEAIQPERQSPAWRKRLDNLAGEGHQLGLDEAIKERRFDAALAHAVAASERLGLDEEEYRGRVTESMLAEIRRLYAAGPEGRDALTAMIGQAGKLAGGIPPEAKFWSALDDIRAGHLDEALAALSALHEEAGKQVIDIPFYLGLVLYQLGRPQEALRVFGEANRLDPNCPFVTLYMGKSIMATGGDSGIAMRAILKAVGPRGLLTWQGQPDRVWIEAFPEGRSYVRRLATRHRFTCPIMGGDLAVILRQGQISLAQACYRQEKFQEAADLYAKLLQDSPPTSALTRGYGLSLARLGQHDIAYKHLRLALEQEDPKDPSTAGYLALCGAMGKPTNPADKPRNLTWALALLARYPVLNEIEWAGIISAVHAEARKAGCDIPEKDQVLLCDTQASVLAADPRAAVGYAHLASSHPQAVKPAHAFLYSRAAAQSFQSPRDLDLFAITFQHAGQARAFFEKQGWDFGEVEYVYLARTSTQAPGSFPEALGTGYADRGEAFLLERSREQEQAGKKEPARETAEVLIRLAPRSLAAHDRLACLHYRMGNVDRSVELLDGWRRLAPEDHWPLVRQAIIEQERGNAANRAEAIDRALGLTRGPLRASIAFLGARLALREGVRPGLERSPTADSALAAGQRLLKECLREQPDHAEALWCLAAVKSVQGDTPGLADLAPQMDRPNVTDARFHYLGAVCSLASGNYRRVVELGERAVRDPNLATESRFVMAWAALHLGDAEAAAKLFGKVADQTASPSAVYAKAILGKLHSERGDIDEAVACWASLEPKWRARWGLDDPLRQSVFLSGLVALDERRFEFAADRFKEAGKLGLRERCLGGLITLALVKAGQRLLFEETR